MDQNEFTTLTALQAQAGRPAIAQLLTRFRANIEQTVAALSKMKTGPLDLPAVKMIAHRMCGACGSLGFLHIAGLFERMDHAVDRQDSEDILKTIAEVEAEKAVLTGAIGQHYPETEPVA